MNTFERRKFVVDPEGKTQEQKVIEEEKSELQRKIDIGKKRPLRMRDGKLGFVTKDKLGNEIFEEVESKERKFETKKFVVDPEGEAKGQELSEEEKAELQKK